MRARLPFAVLALLLAAAPLRADAQDEALALRTTPTVKVVQSVGPAVVNVYQDLVLSVHHAMMHTMAMSPCTKLIENHTGRAFVRSQQQVAFGPFMPTLGAMPGP